MDNPIHAFLAASFTVRNLYKPFTDRWLVLLVFDDPLLERVIAILHAVCGEVLKPGLVREVS